MIKRLITVVLLVGALVSASSEAPAQMCGMSMPALPAMKCTGCCATMKSCVLPQRNPALPTAAVEQIQQSIVMIAPVLHESLSPVIAGPSCSREFLAAQHSVHSPPRLALFCTFLI